jgi:hypothetical protein
MSITPPGVSLRVESFRTSEQLIESELSTWYQETLKEKFSCELEAAVIPLLLQVLKLLCLSSLDETPAQRMEKAQSEFLAFFKGKDSRAQFREWVMAHLMRAVGDKSGRELKTAMEAESFRRLLQLVPEHYRGLLRKHVWEPYSKELSRWEVHSFFPGFTADPALKLDRAMFTHVLDAIWSNLPTDN